MLFRDCYSVKCGGSTQGMGVRIVAKDGTCRSFEVRDLAKGVCVEMLVVIGSADVFWGVLSRISESLCVNFAVGNLLEFFLEA